MEIEKLVQEGAKLKASIDEQTKRLREINGTIAQAAEFEDGKKTGHLVCTGYKVKVVLRDNVKWDQDKLAQVVQLIPSAAGCFKTELKPDNKKLDAAIAKSEDLEKAINWARTVTPGSPTVTYEEVF